jgi:ABC-type transport system involved in multi-copper enzyme maturation permease subunit
MSTTLPTLPTLQTLPEQQPIPAASRVPSVVEGRSDYLSVLLRLTAAELYKLRRRALSKVVASMSIGAIVLAFALIAVYIVTQMNVPATDFAPPQCSQVAQSQAQNTVCINHQPTQAELAHYKQASIKDLASSSLTLPGSLNIIYIVTIKLSILVLTIIIVAGTIVGGEYGYGTVRLLFTRGPTRVQFLLAKVLALAASTMLGLLTITVVGVLLGYALYPITGLVPDFHFFTAAWLGYALLLVLLQMLGWFIYAILALFIGTLGRSSVAGIVGGVIWLFMEFILNNVLPGLGAIIGGSLGKVVSAIPDYFVVNNINALVQNLAYSMGKNPASSLSTLHSLLVFAGYLVVCIGLSCWLTVKRDVTN